MPAPTAGFPDVMQVCRNGHVITDQLQGRPDLARSHCERCGAATLSSCPTCGRALPGSLRVAGLEPIGAPRPPSYCEACGAAFPWVQQAGRTVAAPLNDLAALLRRVPRVIRQLRARQGDRQPLRVEDEKDLEDLLRALLALRFDDVRPQLRTPRYAPGTRTDYLLAPEGIAVVCKQCRPGVREPQLREQVREDVEFYRRERTCRTLVVFVYDPEGLLHEPHLVPADAGEAESELEVVSVVAVLT
jgi:hypothetical protein